MKKWPMFEKWASRCPNSARIPRNSAEGAFYTYANPKKRGIFRGKLSKKGTFWEVFEPEFRGIPRRFRKPPKSAKFGILALKLTEIRKLQLLRWIREEAGQCRLSVSPTMQFPLKITGFCKKAREFQENAKMMVHSGRKRSVTLLFRLSSHSVCKHS